MKIIHNSTSVALWYDIILEAEAACKVILKSDVESYLVFLLMRYTNKPEVIKQIMATEFLYAINTLPSQRQLILQEVGDKCLIFSGLFPGVAKRRLVKLNYFIQLGQSAYANLAKDRDDTYQILANQFVEVMDILQSIRADSVNLLPLEAYELWAETGSHRALALLKQYTNCHSNIMNMPFIDHNISK